MFENRFEIFGGALAVLVVIVMGVLVFTGPFHKINKPAPAAAVSAISHPAKTVDIVTDPTQIAIYKPKTVTIRLGQAVRFKNISNLVHTVTADNNSFNSGDIGTAGASWVFRPPKAGTFKYFCSVHPNMRGTLVVQG